MEESRKNPLTIRTRVRVDTPLGTIWIGWVIGFRETLSRQRPNTVSRELRLRLDPRRTDRGVISFKGPNVPAPAWNRGGPGWVVRKLVQTDVPVETGYLVEWIYPPMAKGWTDPGVEPWGPLELELLDLSIEERLAQQIAAARSDE